MRLPLRDVVGIVGHVPSGSIVTSLLAFVALATVGHAVLASQQDPRDVRRTATRAVEGDSAERVGARYADRAARDSSDRAALFGLATLARLRYDYPAAERGYRALMTDQRDRYTVYARLGLAEGFEERSSSRTSRPELEQARAAARALGDRVAEGEALIWLAFVRGRLEGVHVAEALLDTAARLLPDTVFDLWSRLRARRAIVLALRARPAEAAVEAESSVALARRARDPRAEAVGFRALGQVLQYRGQLDSALTALRRSEELYRTARSRSALAASLVWHAQVLGGLARFGEMRETMQRALTEGEATHNPGAMGDAHRALGVLALMLGDPSTAAVRFRRAAAIADSSGDSSGVLSTRKYLAQVALSAGDMPVARRLALEQLAWARRAQDAQAQFEAWRMLADIGAREKDWAAAARALANARSQLRRLPGTNYRMWLTHDDARLALARGDLATAERSLGQYLRWAAGAEPGVNRFDARIRLADVYARRNDLVRAEREMTAATEEVERWRARLDAAAQRSLAFQAAATAGAASAEPASSAMSAARVLAALASGGRVDAALSLAERWRARDLADRLARAAALRTTAPLPQADAQTGVAPLSARQIMEALPDEQTAIIEFVAVEGAPITMFVVQRHNVQARVLPPVDSLGQSVSRFITLIESGADPSSLGRSLGAVLVDPATALLDRRVTRVLLIPDGPLHRLPFDALRMADGRYVVERYAVGFAPSASLVATLRARRARSGGVPTSRLLALADPAAPVASGEPRDAAVTSFLAAGEAAGGFPRLRGAAYEARLVARYAHSANVYVGGDATAALLKQADLRGYRVLHFATHAIVDERSVAGTALALAPGGGESGFLGAGDLAALRLDADLVVLSACRTAGGVVVTGEGIQGLTSPLLAAGARAIIATHWRIGDRGAVPLVDATYAALARGATVIDALRTAKLRAHARGEPPSAWASFVSIGDPSVVVPLRQPRFFQRWLEVLRRAWSGSGSPDQGR